jgi:Protein of unknown function (DUF3592)
MSLSLIFLIVLVVISTIGVLVQLFIIMNDRSRQRQWQERRAIAIVLKISMEPGILRDHWYTTVTWSDRHAGNTYTFSGSPSPFRPRWHVGQSVRIAFNEERPENFKILQ